MGNESHKINGFQQKLEKVTREWWFLIILGILFFMPAYTSKVTSPQETSNIVKEVLQNPLIDTFPLLFVVSKVAIICLILLVIFYGKKMTRAFSISIALSYIAIALFQNMAITNTYGFVILTGNVVVTMVLAFFWAWEAISLKNDFSVMKFPIRKIWIVILALLAFWFPVDLNTITPAFTLSNLFSNNSMLTFCMITPVVLALLSIFSPDINVATYRITGFIGMLFGIMNMITWFALNPSMCWMGVVHMPLMIISTYTFCVSLKKRLVNVNTIYDMNISN